MNRTKNREEGNQQEPRYLSPRHRKMVKKATAVNNNEEIVIKNEEDAIKLETDSRDSVNLKKENAVNTKKDRINHLSIYDPLNGMTAPDAGVLNDEDDSEEEWYKDCCAHLCPNHKIEKCISSRSLHKYFKLKNEVLVLKRALHISLLQLQQCPPPTIVLHSSNQVYHHRDANNNVFVSAVTPGATTIPLDVDKVLADANEAYMKTYNQPLFPSDGAGSIVIQREKLNK